MGMLIHRRNASKVTSKTTKVADVTPAEEKPKKETKKESSKK